MKFTDLFEATTSRKQSAPSKNDKREYSKTVVLGRYNGRRNSEPGSTPYDLKRIKQAVTTDSYIAVAVRKFSQLICKAGYQLKSKNEDAVNYLEQRLRIIEFRSKIPFYVLITSIAKDLYTYSNSYIIKVRDNNLSKFGIKAEGLYQTNNAIAGLFLADPTSVEIERNDDGMIEKYLIDNQEYKPDDIIHLYLDKQSDSEYGTSRLYPVLEDATMLRKAEGLVMTILYRFAIPILHIKVGSTKEGMYATDKEIRDTRDEFENLANDGFIVTNERTEIKAITPDMNANQLLTFLEYNEKRIFTGLNTSNTIMGREKATSGDSSSETQMYDEVKACQRVMSSFIEKYLFTEILLEGGFNPILNKDDYVHFDFNEVNVDTKVKLESHTIQKYQGNVISLEEARRELGFDNEVSEQDMYAFTVTQQAKLDLVDAQADASIKVAKEQSKLNAAAQSSNDDDALDKRKFNGKQQSTDPNGFFSNDANPQNQNTDSVQTQESLADNENQYETKFADIHQVYSKLSNILDEDLSNTDAIVGVQGELLKALDEHLIDSAKKGIADSSANNKTNNQMIDPVIGPIEDYSSKK